MAIKDDILAIIDRKRRPLSEEDIVEFLYGQGTPAGRISHPLRELVERKLLLPSGKGGPADPYKYSRPPLRRR